MRVCMVHACMQVAAFLRGLEAEGGDDLPEDIAGALLKVRCKRPLAPPPRLTACLA